MAQNTGTLVTAAIRPNDDADQIASALASEIKGGHHSCMTLTMRDAIISARREWGMLATVTQDGSNNDTYQLTYGYADTNIDNNANWKPKPFSANGNITSVIEYPIITDGQITVTPVVKPASKLLVHLNGLELHIRDDFTINDDWTVVFAFPLISNDLHADLVKLEHD